MPRNLISSPHLLSSLHPPSLPYRRAQVELHPSHDRPLPGGDAGAAARLEERHDPHLPRHDGLGAAAQRQLQAGRLKQHDSLVRSRRGVLKRKINHLNLIKI